MRQEGSEGNSLFKEPKMEENKSREICTEETFNVPVELMWKAWTDPDHIAVWWGPAGFTTTIHVMDVQQNGEWKLTLHGPDGTNYPNRSIYQEIDPFKKIVFEHFNPHFITTVLFTSEGQKTKLTWTMLFDSPEMREIIVKTHNADEGQEQNMERLANYLARVIGG